MRYIRRAMEDTFLRLSKEFPALLLTGPRQVGKTTMLQKLAEEGQLMSYIHKGFWQCMDTAREKQVLEKMLATGNAPWKKWED